MFTLVELLQKIYAG